MIRIERFVGPSQIAPFLEDLARLRIQIFVDYPYLYDGNLDSEMDYLAAFSHAEQALLVGAFDGERMVGASTGAPMEAHQDDFAAAFSKTAFQLSDIYYLAESVLRPEYRGQGIGHAFFDQREGFARQIGRSHCAFCSVVRDGHPSQPKDHRSHHQFWLGRGYHPLPGVLAYFKWKDIGQSQDTEKPLQFWLRSRPVDSSAP